VHATVTFLALGCGSTQEEPLRHRIAGTLADVTRVASGHKARLCQYQYGALQMMKPIFMHQTSCILSMHPNAPAQTM
jgi:hypothetical protein